MGRQVMAQIFGRCGSLPLRERLGVPLVVLILLIFICVGIHSIIYPRRHMRGSLRREGEMLREWNETGVQFAGLVFSCGAGWMLCELIRSVLSECF